MSDKRITLSIHEPTFEQLSKLKADGVSWDATLKTLAAVYEQEYGADKTPLEL